MLDFLTSFLIDSMLWILVLTGFVLSFVSLIQPILPGIPLLWISFLIYHFGIDKSELTTSFWIILSIFTVFLLVVDFIANNFFLKKYGSTKWGERVGCLAIILGSFIIPPLGLIIVPFVSVYAVERYQNKSNKEALIIASATVVSFLTSSIAKGLLQMMLILIFFIYIIF